MKQSIRLGRIAGIPIGMHWSVLVIVALITDMLAASVLPGIIPHQSAGVYWTVAAAGSVLFVAALAAHEIAHAIVARRWGVQVRSITLWMLGGIAELDGDPPTAAADLQIAIAGPATSLAAGIIFGGAAALARLGHGPAVIVAALAWLSLMNVVLAVFNLLPGAPLDGGRILRGLLWKRYGDRQRASQAAARSGQVLGAGLGLVGLLELFAWQDIGGLWLMLIGWFLVTMARAEQRSDVARAALAGLRVRDIMLARPDIGYAGSDVADFTDRVVLSSRQTVFPVVSFEGGLAGVVFAEELAHVPPAGRATTRLGEIATPVPPTYRADADAAASSLLNRSPLRGQLLAVVMQDQQVAGLVTTEELQFAMLRARLRASQPALGHAPLPRGQDAVGAARQPPRVGRA
ncbi:MAG TPA: site-2 protease family protein [Streptosporangiaceae bacterium]|nr:site-2 protease family protein [Streptosporangiaceae bacterium]